MASIQSNTLDALIDEVVGLDAKRDPQHAAIAYETTSEVLLPKAQG